MISSNGLIIYQIIDSGSAALCLSIKGLDNQDQELNYRINQYLSNVNLVFLLWPRITLYTEFEDRSISFFHINLIAQDNVTLLSDKTKTMVYTYILLHGYEQKVW